jgi:malate synthase
VSVSAADLLDVPAGTITEKGVRHNTDVAVRYMAAWLTGQGCVPLYNLMEDAATAEISRSQLWQWVHDENAKLHDGRPITETWMRKVLGEVLGKIRDEVGPERFASEQYELAGRLIEQIVLAPTFTAFMTSVGYEYLD